MSNTHKAFHYSVTLHTDDLATLGCLRSLSQHSQPTGNARVPWGGTKREDWQRDRHQATFRFTSPIYRADFIGHAERLLPTEMWHIVGQNDNDPATPQGGH
jgi:hypothetical protein